MALMDKLRIAEETPEEIDEVLDPDPVPDEKPTTRRKPAPRKPVPKRTPATSVDKMAKEVGNDLATMFEMTAAVWSLRDQCCAPVLEQQAKPLGQAIAAILARNPEMLAKFANANSGLFLMQCLALGQAILPLGQAIVTNHVLKPSEIAGPEFVDPTAVDLGTFPAFSGVPRAHTA